VTGPGISCAGDCTETYDQGQAVTLTATATNGSTFAGWSGACSGTGACKVTMDANKSVSATFNPHAPPPLPGSYLLRPDSDLLTGWSVYGATSAWSALDESITTSTRASATDYVQPSAGGQVTTVGFSTQALNGRAVDAATLYYYGKTWTSDTQLRVEARSGGQTLATQTLAPGSTYAWRSLTVVLPDQVAVDDLNLRLTAIGGMHAVVRAAYVELDLG
jgi:hypothetical protein